MCAMLQPSAHCPAPLPPPAVPPARAALAIGFPFYIPKFSAPLFNSRLALVGNHLLLFFCSSGVVGVFSFYFIFHFLLTARTITSIYTDTPCYQE